MFTEFCMPASVPALTLSAVQRITGLTWTRIEVDSSDATSTIPTDTGVYLWVDPQEPHIVRYHGRGTGATGLRGRLSGHLRWRAKQLERVADFEADDRWEHGWAMAAEVPVVREVAERRLQLWTAAAVPADWTVPTDFTPPVNATEWESFISEVSHLAAGHRGIVGGGAWESKGGSLGERMCDVAWDRMIEVARDWRN